MDLFRKAFLLVVGLLSIAIEETNKSVIEASKSLDEQREKLAQRAKPA